MSEDRHFGEIELRRFERRDMPVEDGRRVVQHLAQGCPECGTAAARVLGFALAPAAKDEASQPPISASALERILSRVRERESLLARERAEAASLVERLRKHPQARRQTMIRNSRRYFIWGLGELLIENAKEAVFDDVGVALEWADLGVMVAEGLDPAVYGDALVSDLAGRALAALGNARRASSDLIGAEAAFTAARNRLDDGTGDPLEEGYVAHCVGSLRLAQRRFVEAGRSFHHAIGIFRRLGDNHLQGRSLIGRAIVLLRQGELDGAIRLMERALSLIDSERDPRLLLIGLHNLASVLAEQGKAERALNVLAKARPMYERLGDRLNLMKLRWLEARIAVAMGDNALAESALLEVKQAFTQRQIPYEAAVAALELAAIYVEQGRTVEVKLLVAEMLPIFQALHIHREALAALILFRQAVEREAATVALVREVVAFLEKARHNPGLRFLATSLS